VASRAGLPPSRDSLVTPLWASLLGCVAIYGALFGAGSLLYGRTVQATVCLAASAVAAVGIARLLPRILAAER
jgi:hypothetical protein